jgi:hypothetical protein
MAFFAVRTVKDCADLFEIEPTALLARCVPPEDEPECDVELYYETDGRGCSSVTSTTDVSAGRGGQ